LATIVASSPDTREKAGSVIDQPSKAEGVRIARPRRQSQVLSFWRASNVFRRKKPAAYVERRAKLNRRNENPPHLDHREAPAFPPLTTFLGCAKENMSPREQERCGPGYHLRLSRKRRLPCGCSPQFSPCCW
jgi:hypothetical protein